jgi:hypothetical protein
MLPKDTEVPFSVSACRILNTVTKTCCCLSRSSLPHGNHITSHRIACPSPSGKIEFGNGKREARLGTDLDSDLGSARKREGGEIAVTS